MDNLNIKSDGTVTVEETGLKSKFAFWKKLNHQQKTSLVSFVLFLLIIPVAIFASVNQVNLYQKASENSSTENECQKKGGVCCPGEISNCICPGCAESGRLISYWTSDEFDFLSGKTTPGKITTSGGCNPNKETGGPSCCKSCRYPSLNATSSPSPETSPTAGQPLPTATTAPNLSPTITPSPTPIPQTSTPQPTTGSQTFSTITLQQGLNNYSGTANTYLHMYSSSNNFCSATTVTVGYKQTYNSLFRFDLSSIPIGSVVQNANLQIYVSGWGGANLSIDVFKVLRSWNACQATWTKASLTDNWQSAGCNGPTDRESLPLATITNAGQNKWSQFDLTKAVQEWVNNPRNNKGILLRQKDTKAYSLYFANSNYSPSSYRPKLTITYKAP